jgi:hypothetical protein
MSAKMAKCDFSSLRLIFGYANLMPLVVQQITKALDVAGDLLLGLGERPIGHVCLTAPHP